MHLCSPLLVGPVSVWSDKITVEGCMPGATISIRAIGSNPRLIASGTATGKGRDVLDVKLGERLGADDRLSARQELGDLVSRWTDETDVRLALAVSPAPK